MMIVVGSTNPVKIHAVKRVAEAIWSDCEVSGVETESGVNSQPRTDEETKIGSINRAKNALKLTYSSSESMNREEISRLRSKNKGLEVENSKLEITLGIGLEGGVFETENGEMWNTVWVSVADQDGNVVSVNGSRFLIPKEVADGIRAGEEMGVVVDRITGIHNIKHKGGFIGYVTKEVVDRTSEYSNLARLAIGLWVGSQSK